MRHVGEQGSRGAERLEVEPRASGDRQRTLLGPVRCAGLGLHSGAEAQLVLKPAEAGSGIAFRRAAGTRGVIAALWRNVVDTRLCTVLRNDTGDSVATVEHLLAALTGCGIDNALIEIDGPEIPALDGSAAPFAALIDEAGIREQDEPRRRVEVLRPIRVEAGERRATLEPARAFSAEVEIVFNAPAIGRQRAQFDPMRDDFRTAVAPARTFALLDDVEAMQASGYALGGSLRNAVVVSGARVLNPEGLRLANEFARHKLLDCLGDLALAGGPVLGRFHGHRCGHGVNIALLRALFADSANWRWAAHSAEGAAAPQPARRLAHR